MTKAEKIIRDILNDRCQSFTVIQDDSKSAFILKFDIHQTDLNFINLSNFKSIVDQLNVFDLRVHQYHKGFRVNIYDIDASLKENALTVDSVKATKDLTIGPVRCRSCKGSSFKTLSLALEHVQLVHGGEIKLDATFDKTG